MFRRSPRSPHSLFSFWGAFGTVLLCCSVARPDTEDPEYTQLARISFIEGVVSYQMSSETDWSAASVNMPLEPGDRIYTGKEGKAAIEFEDGSVLQLAEDTDLEILSLSDEIIQLRMFLGLATLTSSGAARFEVGAPGGSFRTVRKGVYRFDVMENGDTDAIVRKGELDAANASFSDHIETGELLHISPSRDGEPELSRYEGRDSWDQWTDRRSADSTPYRSRKYVPNTVSMGVSELDKYGRWVSVEYGDAWVPDDIDDDWSPYSVGRWCYRPHLGWTWISYERWGWLPYHYGRWYRNPRHGWCWIPGPSFSFHFWSPGLVSFYLGGGWVSWCPLGPGDYYDIGNYRYHRGRHRRYLADMDSLHKRRAGDHFNRHAHNAFRGAPVDRFKDGGPGGGPSLGRWGSAADHWKRGTLVRGKLLVTPTRVSFRANPHVSPVRPRVEPSHPTIIRHVPSAGASRGRFVRVPDSEADAPSRRAWSGRGNPDGRKLNSAFPDRNGEEASRPDSRRLRAIDAIRARRSHPKAGGKRGDDRTRDDNPPLPENRERVKSPEPNPTPPKERKLGRWGSVDE